jgi:hypothetical protein
MFAVGAVFALASIAGALKPETLQGEYQLAGPLDHKGSPGEGRSHLYLSLTDAAASTLYESLAVDEHDDPCTGYRVKARGNIACYEVKRKEKHFCSFSINLDRGAIEAGLGGCI